MAIPLLLSLPMCSQIMQAGMSPFYLSDSVRVNCRFDLFNTPILSPVTIVDSSTITCQTPINYGIARPIAMDIVYDNTPFTGSFLNFTFYGKSLQVFSDYRRLHWNILWKLL